MYSILKEIMRVIMITNMAINNYLEIAIVINQSHLLIIAFFSPKPSQCGVLDEKTKQIQLMSNPSWS